MALKTPPSQVDPENALRVITKGVLMLEKTHCINKRCFHLRRSSRETHRTGSERVTVGHGISQRDIQRAVVLD